ncbi:MAG TPA: ATP-binding protein [Verrucomicrobiae bacterium]|nr:ATP-binding protein [Verrucomicrobiae bacterium]
MESQANLQSDATGAACLCPEFPDHSHHTSPHQLNIEKRAGPAGERNLSALQERLRLALSAGGMGVWELPLDNSGCLVLSPELQSILEIKGDFDGRISSFMGHVHPADRVAVLKRLVRCIRHQSDPELEFRFLRSGRQPGWLLGRGRLYRDAEGRLSTLVGVGIDITAQKLAELEILRLNSELEQRVAERTAQLQATNKELEAFCYSVSHDLRAPLRSIRGFNEVLLERYSPNLDERGQEFLRRACESSRYMDDLIDDLLKLSRVGRRELIHQQVDLSELACGVIDELRSTEPGRTVEVKIMPGLRTFGDPRLLRIVLDNLLRNAWKFTSKKKEAQISFGEASAPKSAFYVRDNGAGFDPAFAGRLFGVFQRLHSASEFAGTGVGLATVQRIINRHGGQVWAEGAIDQGATFYFSLPAHETN